MGKKTKRVQKNMAINQDHQQTNTDLPQAEQMAEIKAKISALREEEKYEDALQVIIEAFEQNLVDLELLFATAELYYLSGDYQRAVVWAEKTLSFAPDHIQAWLLLGKVYALQDEAEKCFDVLERHLGSVVLSRDERTEAEDLLEYFEMDFTDEEIENNYPIIWKFKNSEDIAERCDLPESDMTAPADEAADAQAPEAQESGSIAAAEEDSLAALEKKKIEDVIQGIMDQPVSLLEKVDSCLHFAVCYYVLHDIAKCLMVLKQAFLIDGKNPLVLKNIAFILVEMGDKEGAMEFLTRIKEKDLTVLHQIDLFTQK